MSFILGALIGFVPCVSVILCKKQQLFSVKLRTIYDEDYLSAIQALMHQYQSQGKKELETLDLKMPKEKIVALAINHMVQLCEDLKQCLKR